jgi:hypothetical protein
MAGENGAGRRGARGSTRSGGHAAQPAKVFSFRFADRYRLPALVFGVTPSTAWVAVGAGRLVARFGPWRVRTPLQNIAGVEVTGPYSFLGSAGPARLALTGRGITFATNGERGVCVRFHVPVRGIEPTGTLRHPTLTLTVLDIDGLHAALRRGTGPPPRGGT